MYLQILKKKKNQNSLFELKSFTFTWNFMNPSQDNCLPWKLGEGKQAQLSIHLKEDTQIFFFPPLRVLMSYKPSKNLNFWWKVVLNEH